MYQRATEVKIGCKQKRCGTHSLSRRLSMKYSTPSPNNAIIVLICRPFQIAASIVVLLSPVFSMSHIQAVRCELSTSLGRSVRSERPEALSSAHCRRARCSADPFCQNLRRRLVSWSKKHAKSRRRSWYASLEAPVEVVLSHIL